MSMKKIRSDYRVIVYPRDPGDFGVAHLSGQQRTEDEWEALCREIAGDVERHVNNLPTIGAKTAIVWTTDHICEHCEAIWTEGDSPHNGGCCEKDCDVFEATP